MILSLSFSPIAFLFLLKDVKSNNKTADERVINMKKISASLQKSKVLLSDGAWGTQLIALGLKPGECPDLCSVNRYEDVKMIASRYILAGAAMVKTNSFGANRFKLAHYGLSDKVEEINISAAKASREAAQDNAFVLASVGPTGMLLITEEVTVKELYDAFKEQIIALEKGGADAVLIETMSDIQEAGAAIKAAKDNTDLEVITTFVFEKTVKNTYMTMMGVSPTQAVTAALEAGSDIIGANCGNGFDKMIDIVKEIRSSFKDIPILIHANAGMPVIVNGKITFPETPEIMAPKIPALIEAGADIIGGCCGTTPEHIIAFKREIDKYLLETSCQNG